IAGLKDWTVYADYASQVELPLPVTDWNPDRYTPRAVAETLTLKPGDVLYLPRGTMHSAACSTRESMHLTLAIASTTYADLLARAAEVAADANVELRRRVPLSAGTTDTELEALADTVREIVLAELARVDLRRL